MMLVAFPLQPTTRSSHLLQTAAYVASLNALEAEVSTDASEETLKGKVTHSKAPNTPIG